MGSVSAGAPTSTPATAARTSGFAALLACGVVLHGLSRRAVAVDSVGARLREGVHSGGESVAMCAMSGGVRRSAIKIPVRALVYTGVPVHQ